MSSRRRLRANELSAGVERDTAIGSFLWGGRERVLALLPMLKQAGRPLEFGFRGGSMRPAIVAGSRLRVDTAAHADCEVGRAVAYIAADRVMVHRVVYRPRSPRARGYVITCGDRLVIPDPPVDRNWILGPVVSVQTEGRRWTTPGPAFRRPSARLRASFLAALVGALLEVDVRLARGAVQAMHWMRTAILPKQPRDPETMPGASRLFDA